MRRLGASLRRATPKGHETFISRTAPHQEPVPTSGPPCVQDTLRHPQDELRRRARAGDSHALHHLAGWLSEQGGLDKLRELLTDHRELLASSWEPTYGQHQLEVLHLRADLGGENARRTLAHRLTRMKERTQDNPEH